MIINFVFTFGSQLYIFLKVPWNHYVIRLHDASLIVVTF